MSFFTSYDLRGWGPSGRFLSAFEKEEIQDYVLDEGVEDCGCSHSDSDEYIMSFCDTSFHAYDNVRKALSDYASRRPDFLLELDFASEAEDHQRIRFRGDDVEELDRMEFYPPFVKLTRKDDDAPLHVLEFNFASTCRDEEKRVLVLLGRRLLLDELKALEDSIASYDGRMENYSPVEMIDDVLNAEHIDHWIVKPLHSFTI